MSEKREYEVAVTVPCNVWMFVEASDEEEAIRLAREAFDRGDRHPDHPEFDHADWDRADAYDTGRRSDPTETAESTE